MNIKVDEHLSLRSLEIEDASDIFNTIDSQRSYLGKWLPFVAFTQKQSNTEDFIKSMLSSQDDHQNYIFTIRKKDVFAGIIGLKDTDKLNNKTEIGYWLSEGFQKQGIMSKSVKALSNYVFDQLKMNRIQIKCATKNFASKNIPIRLGFKFEGIERDGELLSDGNYTDLEIYSSLKSELN